MDGDQLVDLAQGLTDRRGFLEFLDALIENRRQYPEEWENNTLELFLTAFAQFTSNAEGYYQNIGNPDVDLQNPSWRTLADAFLAAKVYE